MCKSGSVEGLSVETVSRDGSCQFSHCIFNTHFPGVKNIIWKNVFSFPGFGVMTLYCGSMVC
jgi:hypothetical protein